MKKKSWRDLRFDWDEEFLAQAIDAAGRSSCKKLHTGAVIVKDNRIIATGYNGCAPGFKKNCLEAGCAKEEKGVEGYNLLACVGSHAEANALLQDTAKSKKNAKIYTIYSPCYSCAKMIAAAKLSEVIYIKRYLGQHGKEFDAVQEYFDAAGIIMRQFKLKKERLIGIIDEIL